MQTWEKREKTTKRIALILSIALHVAFFTALAAYTNSGSGGSLIDWAKQFFQTEVQEAPAQTAKNT